jgi:phosphoribosylformimino-5-aminoimidazole carboxamide ribotide isomerase
VTATIKQMRVIPVIDVMKGQVVRGVAGRRSEYRPIASQIAPDSQPATVARAFVQQFDFHTVYVADLDGIMRREPDIHAMQEIRAAGLNVWLDAGMDPKGLVWELRKRGSSLPPETTIVLGSECLHDASTVIDSLPFVGSSRIVFSVDMQAGKLLTNVEGWKFARPMEVIRWTLEAGVKKLLVLDLADVGVGGGTRTLDLCHEIRAEYTSVEIIAGGGVRGTEDLRALFEAGCDAALVASALHDGRLSPDEVRRVESWQR